MLFARYEFEHTNINMDWTSIVLHGNEAKLGKYGYSHDHRPDKKEITVGVTELADPINIPIGITIEPVISTIRRTSSANYAFQLGNISKPN